jgi:tRNA pseudouridine55 synthase
MARNTRPIDGVLLFNKPLHLSSNTALQKVRRLFQAEKAGHTGTLDPLATGLLPICFGESTKFSTGLLNADKAYRAFVKLGQTTTTGDAEGEVVRSCEVNVDEQHVRLVIDRFIGEICQIPPMYSALKHQGKPLYEYIRNGETIERAGRNVIVHDIVLEHFTGDEMNISVRCSKGTYIRTLAEDIGNALGCGAHLRGLHRTAIGEFSIVNALSMEQLEAMTSEERDASLLSVDCMLLDLPKIELDAVQVTRMAQGQRLGLDTSLADGKVRLYGAGKFIGVGDLLGRRLAPDRLLSSVAKSAAIRE